MQRAPGSKVSPQSLSLGGLALGLAMLALGALILWAGDLPLSQTYPLGPRAWGEVFLGGGLGAGVALLAWWLSEYLSPLRAIRQSLLDTLDFASMRPWHPALFGLLAGLPEEFLFRGAIQPQIGLFLTALFFGALHAINRAYFIYATLAGLGLGALAMWRGDLWAATAAHGVYDALLFAALWRYALAKNHGHPVIPDLDELQTGLVPIDDDR